MNKIISIIFILLFLVSCKTSVEYNIIDEPKARETEITSNNPFVLVNTRIFNEKCDYDSWSKYFENEYLLKIDIHKMNKNEPLGSGINIIEVSEFLKLFSDAEKLFQPLNNLEIIDQLDNKLLNTYKNLSGEIYCLPYEQRSGVFFMREYNGIDGNNKFEKIPNEINEILEYLTLISTSGNYEHTLEPLYKYDVLRPYFDFAKSFGLKINTEILPYSPVEYNYNEKYFSDIISTKNMSEFLYYFKTLYEREIIRTSISDLPHRNNNFKEFDKKNIYSIYSTNRKIQNDTMYSTHFINSDYENIELFLPSRVVYVVAKDYENDNGLNEFFNKVYMDNFSAISLKHGINENDYSIVGNEIRLAEHYSPTLISGSFVDSQYHVNTINYESDIKKMEAVKSNANFQYKHIFTNIVENIITFEDRTNGTQVFDFFNIMFYNQYTINDDMVVDEFIKDYIIEMKKNGAEDKINELNKMIGSSYMFNYNK